MTALTKRECWNYEKEWRLIKLVGLNNEPIMEHVQIWKRPSVIYYGKDIDINDEIRLHTYALMNGLEEYRMQYVCDNGQFKLKPVPFECKFEEQCREFIRAHNKTVLESRLMFIDEGIRDLEQKYGITPPQDVRDKPLSNP